MTAFEELHSLLVPGESVWIAETKFPDWPELVFETTIECLQMVLPEEITPPADDALRSFRSPARTRRQWLR